jgi:hypothetical protein
MGLINDAGREIELTDQGRRAAAFQGAPMNAEQTDFWRRTILGITHVDQRGLSHPYQVLLRLVARRPGISRAKCALALEARNDSPEELDRIVELSDLAEEEIRTEINVSKSNWDNAKKVLPKFAEQLGDVIRIGHSFTIADSPGRAPQGRIEEPRAELPGARAPRNSRAVTGETIGRAGIADRSDEVATPPGNPDPAARAETARLRADRLRRHNLLVREIATRLEAGGARLYEDPFDVLALVAASAILIEVKTLDGTEEDERERVRDALAQLLYYESFVTRPVAGETPIQKLACFERQVSAAHTEWLNVQRIATIWKQGDEFRGDALARDFLRGHLQEFR